MLNQPVTFATLHDLLSAFAIAFACGALSVAFPVALYNAFIRPKLYTRRIIKRRCARIN